MIHTKKNISVSRITCHVNCWEGDVGWCTVLRRDDETMYVGNGQMVIKLGVISTVPHPLSVSCPWPIGCKCHGIVRHHGSSLADSGDRVIADQCEYKCQLDFPFADRLRAEMSVGLSIDRYEDVGVVNAYTRVVKSWR